MSRHVTPFFAANWKMHLGPTDTTQFVRRFSELRPARPDARIVFFPPCVSLHAFWSAAQGRPDLELGVQDVHQEESGAHTGAISAPMAADAGATWALVGHSERRREFGDDDERVAAKLRALLASGLRAILCVGETLEEREEGALEAVLARQVAAAMAGLGEDGAFGLTFAYEPVWAIGTGRTASPEDAAEAHAIVRAEVVRTGGSEASPILYGGSVKPGNIGELLAAPGIDGVLVGGASLDPESFAEICSAGA